MKRLRKPVSYYIYPYKVGSHSALELARSLGGKVLKLEGSKARITKETRIINWGSSTCPFKDALNHSYFVNIASNKLLTFQHLSHKDYLRPEEPRIPDWTEDREIATSWLKKDDVVVRKLLTSHSGRGILVIEKGRDELPSAPLYVKYIPKDMEFRVHVFNNEIIDVQRKIRDPDQTPKDWRVRSHGNGFVFVRNGFTTPPSVLIEATKAIACSGLVWGAVDLIWNEKREKGYVLEINTAPGIQGSTIEIYAKAFRRYFSS